MKDLPPGFEIILTNHATGSYTIESADGGLGRDAAVSQAWTDHWRRLVNARLQPKVSYISMVKVDELDVPESVGHEIRRLVAMQRDRYDHGPGRLDNADAYLRHYPEHAEAVERALTTGDLSGLPDLTDPAWRDEAYEYRFRESRSARTSTPRLVRSRRKDRRFRHEFAGRLVIYPDDIERTGDNDAGPTFAIGGRDVVVELEPDDNYLVRAVLDGRELGTGRLFVAIGDRGYGEYTPGDSDRLQVGDADLIVAILACEDERDVTLTIEQIG